MNYVVSGEGMRWTGPHTSFRSPNVPGDIFCFYISDPRSVGISCDESMIVCHRIDRIENFTDHARLTWQKSEISESAENRKVLYLSKELCTIPMSVWEQFEWQKSRPPMGTRPIGQDHAARKKIVDHVNKLL